VDDLLVEAFEPVARDLRTAGFKAALRESSLSMQDGLLYADLKVDGERIAQLRVDPDAPMESRVAMLAQFTQEAMDDNVRRGGAVVAWPACQDGHPHPMTTDLSLETARWSCPVDTAYSIAIGEHTGDHGA
jgi:hypothetical protein